ncbi:DUF5067 domain-containing protein [Enterococcus sp. 669A]|uniref:DUF5067 domain-containing protein n=1 Tax=Candidatus Enterococcus moelleringii TaxID=2815325 RepID=A0ABS3LB15_9ENTE|nr:DUF5067 domain-containing protein [Enterococcus sp. 669A]MBO1306830.1 DUF5067 domain-containing protein [Enterococcus sp. 669A]
MRKLTIILLLSSTLLLSACGNYNDTTGTPAEKLETVTAKEKAEKDDLSFKAGVLETQTYKLKIINTEIIQSASAEKPGLYVSFELTNKSEETLRPFDVLYDIGFKQQTAASSMEMTSGYRSFDAFGQDAKSVNIMTERQNALSDDLEPGKTMKIYNAYSLDNPTDEVQVFPTINNFNNDDFDAYVIDLTELTPKNNGA